MAQNVPAPLSQSPTWTPYPPVISAELGELNQTDFSLKAPRIQLPKPFCLSAFLPVSQRGLAGAREWATNGSHCSHSETPWRGEKREATTAWQLHWSLISFNGTATMIHTMLGTRTHRRAHTYLTSGRLVRNDFGTLDKFAVAGSLYLPVIAFLCPLSALPSKMFCASGS